MERLSFLKKIAETLRNLPFIKGDVFSRNASGEIYQREQKLKAQERQQRQEELDQQAMEERMKK